ncbi:MAG: polyketide synthase dehydratase domain-containing protein [Planctomycetes bacterium]|nr:polyketide synthase dehydratase domain-containing protein [Planctomycetota bacterium]
MTFPADNSTHDDPPWDAELFVLRGEDRAELRGKLAEFEQLLNAAPEAGLCDLASNLNSGLAPGGVRLAIVAKSREDLEAKLARAAGKLADPACEKIRDVTGIYFFAEPLHPQGKIAFLFPGEGAQYLHMLGDLLPHFPVLDAVLADCDEIAARPEMTMLSPRRFIAFPKDAAPEEREAAERELRRLGNAMFSVLVADLALFHLLEQFGVTPDMIGGHSAGELAALMASGATSDEHDTTERVVHTMQALEEMEDETGIEPAVLLAVGASREKMTALLEAAGVENAFVAMDNCPHQTVLVGEAAPMAEVEARLQKEGYVFERLTLTRPYHTKLFEPYSAPLAEMLEGIPFQAPAGKLYSCTTAAEFPSDPAAMRSLTLAHWFSPVEFTQMIRNMYDDGARLFVEVGPRGNLTSFVEDILRGRPSLAIPADTPRRSGITQLHHLLAQLAAHDVPLDLAPLYDHRLTKDDSRGPAASGGQHYESLTTTSHTDVVTGHLSLMDQFLGDQEAVMQQYLAARQAGRLPARGRRGGGRVATAVMASDASVHPPEAVSLRLGEDDETALGPRPLPLLGEIVHHEPGQHVVMRRRLDLAEDLFAADHTVGGRLVSKVHPDHYGLPIGPMTFTLELMAETAALLAPEMAAVEVKDVRLFRWLAYHEDAPGEIEVTANVVGTLQAPSDKPADLRSENGTRSVPATLEVDVRLSIVDNGNLPPGETAGPAAVGRVVLAPAYPAAPAAEPLDLTGRRPVSVTLERLYHDLFHGPLFMGVTDLIAIGEEGIEAEAIALPRQGLLRSTDDPQFLLDPVLMDVAMHPLCAWHLEQPDLAGRTLLPFELQSMKVYGPQPAEGMRLRVRGKIVEKSPRHFVHGVEVLDEHGRLWCELVAKYWRFYMPYGDVNFHGRKDEYFISNRWDEAVADTPRGVCVRLEPPVDLHQPAMQMVTAKITLSDDEMREYCRMNVPPKKRFDWVFGRLAAKDAVRLAWWEQHGERFFPADMEIKHDERGRPWAMHLGYGEDAAMPNVSVSHADGVMAALASFEPHLGIDLEKIEPREASFGALAFDDEERRLLDEQLDRMEAVTRFWCAKEAVAKALGRGLSEGPRSVTVRAFDPASGGVEVELGAALAAEFPDFAGKRLTAFTRRYKNFIVATTFCDRA